MPNAFVPDEPTGTPDFVTKSRAHRQRVLDAIPPSLRLSATIIDNLPLDVTGVPKSCGLLTSDEFAMTEMDATAVRDAVASRSVTAVRAVTAFAKRAAVAHQLVNCEKAAITTRAPNTDDSGLTDFFMEAAIEQAKKLDEHMEKTGKPVGPLHGVPVSIKASAFPACVSYQPLTSSSVTCLSPERGRHDPSCATLPSPSRTRPPWLSCGASAPSSTARQTARSPVSPSRPTASTVERWDVFQHEYSLLMVRQLSPYNRSLSPGGSSGGESALIALKGSCLGLGS